MNFGENLQTYRKKKGYSQEQLAEKLVVSRQAVSKWESGGSYPEIDKLLQLCELFDCTMDQLVKDKVEVEDNSQPITKKEYIKRQNTFAKAITAGVSTILIGATLYLLVDYLFPSANQSIPVATFLLFTIIGVGIFVYFGIQHDQFSNEPIPEDVYTLADKKKFLPKFAFAIVAGVSLVIFGLIVWVLFEKYCPDKLLSVIFMLIVTMATAIFVYFGMLMGIYEEIIDKTKKKEKMDISNRISGVIMLVATCVYLYLGFVCNSWHPGWIVFPIGGIICGIVTIILGEE